MTRQRGIFVAAMGLGMIGAGIAGVFILLGAHFDILSTWLRLFALLSCVTIFMGPPSFPGDWWGDDDRDWRRYRKSGKWRRGRRRRKFIAGGISAAYAGTSIIAIGIGSVLHILGVGFSFGMAVGLAAAFGLAIAIGLGVGIDLAHMLLHLGLVISAGIGLASDLAVRNLLLMIALSFFLPLISFGFVWKGLVDVVVFGSNEPRARQGPVGHRPQDPTVTTENLPRWMPFSLFLGLGVVVAVWVVVVVGLGLRGLISSIVIVLLAFFMGQGHTIRAPRDNESAEEAQSPAVNAAKRRRRMLLVLGVSASLIATASAGLLAWLGRSLAGFLLLGIQMLAGVAVFVIGVWLTDQATERAAERIVEQIIRKGENGQSKD